MPALAVSYSGLLGGAERILLDVARGLSDPPLIACPEGPLARAARADGLGVFELRERSLELRRGPRDRVSAPLLLAAHRHEVRALVTRLEPSAVIAWGMRSALALGPARRAWPPLIFQHNDLLPGPAITRAVRSVARGAACVTTCSETIARDLDPDGTLGARVEAIPPGVDLAVFSPPGDTLPAGNRVLLLGALERWKRPDLALEAVAIAATELEDIGLRVVGAPIGVDGRRLLDELRRRADRPDLRGRVDFVGPTADPAAELRAAGCLLHCSDREPYGMVVVEALASGLATVVPDAFGPAEIVGEEAGLRFSPGDAPEAATCLVRALRDRDRLGARGRARACERFDVAQTRERYAELLCELSDGKPAARRTEPSGHELSIVTVIHNSEEQLDMLLRSVERELPGAEVVVVDSGSTDAGLVTARAWRGGAAEIVELGSNLGFGRGVNAGIRRASRPVTALLNPDVELVDGSLAAAARAAAEAPGRLLAPLVLLPTGTRQDTAQREPGSPWLGVHALIPGDGLPRPLATAVEPWRGTRPTRVGWAVGCALVAATETFARLGPFDDETFMYGEDLDLGMRASDAGVETWFWPAARVRHLRAHSTAQAFGGEPFELLARRRRAVVEQQRGRRRTAADDVLQAVTFADRLVLKRVLGRDSTREHQQLRALRQARRRPR